MISVVMRRFREWCPYGSVLFEMFADLESNGLGHQKRHGIADLFVLGNARTQEPVGVGERLESGCFAHSERAVLVREVDSSPVRVAFRHDRPGEAVLVQTAVAIGGV